MRAQTLRSVALPTEHGAWGFLAESALIGLVLAPAWGGGLAAVAGVSAFLLGHPLRILLLDRQRGVVSERTQAAAWLAAFYATVAAAAGAWLWVAVPRPWWLPVVGALPLAALQLVATLRNTARTLTAQLAGAVAVAALAPTLLIAGGWPVAPALWFWLLLALRALCAIVTVRDRLRRQKGLAGAGAALWAVYAACGLTVAGLAARGAVPWLVLAGFGLLAAQAAAGRHSRQAVPPQRLGLESLASGLAFTVMLLVAYRGS